MDAVSPDSSRQCCPPFHPELWDEKTHYWVKKRFILETVPQILHRPLPGSMKRTVHRMWSKVKDAHADPPLEEFLLLAHDPSPWTSELYMSTAGEVPGAANITLSGTFLTKVFDGPYSAVPCWIPLLESYVASKGKATKRYFFYFPTCPSCRRRTGHNYCVAFAEVD